jgi:hypothetical protein
MEVEEQMTKLFINDKEYPLADGIIINDKLNEELDSAIVTIPLVDKLNLSPYDKANITGDIIGEKHLLINTWTDTTSSFRPKKYTYNTSLISQTILLQKIVCPDLGITQPIGATKKTIRDKIEEYYEVYIKPQYPELTLSQELLDLTNDVVCPENLFSRPTMFEVFNTLLMKLKCVVRIVNNSITYLKIDKLGKPIDESKLYYENETQNINEYANRLDIQVENAISDKDNYSSISGITLRGGEEPLLTDDNMRLVLDKPIYDIRDIASIYVWFKAKDSKGNEGKVKADISEYVVPKAIYDTYLTSNQLGLVTEKNYKRNALYFNEGGNEILGLNYSEKTWVTNSYIALYNILINKVNMIGDGAVIGFDEADIRNNVLFGVTYRTNDRFRMNVEKENSYNATLIDNQSETQVDAETFGLVEQDKLNRLGNREKIISATYRKGERIPELGDYIGDYVLAEREIVYYDDYALFKGYLYKNYVRKNMFYGLNSKKRFTQISQESVVRNDIENYNVSFEFEEPTNNLKYLTRYLLTPISFSDYPQLILDNKYYNEFPKYCMLNFYDKNDQKINPNAILVGTSSYSTGKSNVIQFKLQDNFSAGIRLTEQVTGGILQKYVKYVDNYGEFKYMTYTILTNQQKDFIENMDGARAIDEYLPVANKLPEVYESDAEYYKWNFILSDTKTLYKDNRETTALTINLNFKNTGDYIIMGALPSYTGLAFHTNLTPAYICYSTEDEYIEGDTEGLGEMITDDSVSVDYTQAVEWLNNKTTFDKLSLYINGVDTSAWKSWGIVTPNNELLVGVNKKNKATIPTTLYMKIEKNDY